MVRSQTGRLYWRNRKFIWPYIPSKDKDNDPKWVRRPARRTTGKGFAGARGIVVDQIGTRPETRPERGRGFPVGAWRMEHSG